MVLTLGGCSRNEDQDEYEREAFRSPSGFTETEFSGKILSEDPDDWRISPMFQGFVEVNIPAHPNPTHGQNIRIELLITGIESVNGLEILSLDDRNQFRQLYFEGSGTLESGFVNVSFDPILFSTTGVYSDAIGLQRVFIYDRNNNMITYGDVMVQ